MASKTDSRVSTRFRVPLSSRGNCHALHRDGNDTAACVKEKTCFYAMLKSLPRNHGDLT
jgi:hypothetical protein